MKKNIALSAFLLLGLSIIAFYGATKIPDLIFVTQKSDFTFEQTVQIIKDEIQNQGWVYNGDNKISNSVKKHIDKDLPSIAVLKVCHPDHAYNILSQERYRHLSALMPCSISVYEGDNQQVYVSHLNTAVMGWMFGNPVRQIMTQDVAQFLNVLTAKL